MDTVTDGESPNKLKIVLIVGKVETFDSRYFHFSSAVLTLSISKG